MCTCRQDINTPWQSWLSMINRLKISNTHNVSSEISPWHTHVKFNLQRLLQCIAVADNKPYTLVTAQYNVSTYQRQDLFMSKTGVFRLKHIISLVVVYVHKITCEFEVMQNVWTHPLVVGVQDIEEEVRLLAENSCLGHLTNLKGCDRMW